MNTELRKGGISPKNYDTETLGLQLTRTACERLFCRLSDACIGVSCRRSRLQVAVGCAPKWTAT